MTSSRGPPPGEQGREGAEVRGIRRLEGIPEAGRDPGAPGAGRGAARRGGGSSAGGSWDWAGASLADEPPALPQGRLSSERASKQPAPLPAADGPSRAVAAIPPAAAAALLGAPKRGSPRPGRDPVPARAGQAAIFPPVLWLPQRLRLQAPPLLVCSPASQGGVGRDTAMPTGGDDREGGVLFF